MSGAGTDLYKAPETWDPDKKIGPPSDIYSFGILLHELFVAEIPWGNMSRQALSTLHQRQSSPPISNSLKERYPAIFKIVQQCLQYEPSKRPTAIQLLDSLKQDTPVVN